MKILVVCQHYYPEPFRLTDICEELVRRGHTVTVITGLPNYPKGILYEGYRGKAGTEETVNGVRVHRCYTIPRGTGAIKRFLNYYSFSISSTRYAKKLKEDYDVIFINQLSPVMMARAGIRYAKKHHKRTLLYSLDLWPESLTAGGIRKSSLIFRHYHKVSEKIYKGVDRICVTSRCFSDYFEREFGIRDTVYLPQYAESLFTPEQCEKKPDGNLDLMFAGNIGAAQSLDTVIRAAELLKDEPRVRFHIVGDGIELENLRRMAQDLPSVVFHGRKPLEEMPRYYAMADAMLVTLSGDSFISSTLPGKVQTYLAAGKPLVGAINGETARLIEDTGCGVCVPSGDAGALADAIRGILNSDDPSALLTSMSDRALTASAGLFSKDLFFDRLTAEFAACPNPASR